jgi:hypothetical protein
MSSPCCFSQPGSSHCCQGTASLPGHCLAPLIRSCPIPANTVMEEHKLGEWASAVSCTLDSGKARPAREVEDSPPCPQALCRPGWACPTPPGSAPQCWASPDPGAARPAACTPPERAGCVGVATDGSIGEGRAGCRGSLSCRYASGAGGRQRWRSIPPPAPSNTAGHYCIG